VEIKIKASIVYDYEKAKFYLAEFDVDKTDERAGCSTPKESVRKPGFQAKCQRSAS
jgi:hypothetical protein